MEEETCIHCGQDLVMHHFRNLRCPVGQTVYQGRRKGHSKLVVENGKIVKEISAFERELASLINRHSKENESNTPDFILAQYMLNCLNAFTLASRTREKWYGKELSIGGVRASTRVEDDPVKGDSLP